MPRLCRRRVLTRLTLVAGGVTLSLALIEGTLRLLAPDSPRGTTYGKPVSFNREGFRDREISVPKPGGVYRVVLLGDSFSWGVGLDLAETVPKVLERRLDAMTPPVLKNHRLEVINAAALGYNTVEEYHRLRDVGLGYDPDLVVLVYNLNDIEYLPELATVPDLGGRATPVVEIDPGEDVTRFSESPGLRGALLAVEQRSVLVRVLVLWNRITRHYLAALLYSCFAGRSAGGRRRRLFSRQRKHLRSRRLLARGGLRCERRSEHGLSSWLRRG